MATAAPKVLNEALEGINEINLAGQDTAPTGARGEHIKQSVSSYYDIMAARAESGGAWNWGMYDPKLAAEIEERIPGFGSIGTDGFSEQLYFQALRALAIPLDGYAGRSVAEVGCGLGVGLNFLSRIVDASRMVGLDLSPSAVEYANASYSRGERLRFIGGDAEHLPFADNELDVVINIESSHNYPSLEGFLREVARVLKPGGFFSHIDFFTRQRDELMARLKSDVGGLTWIQDRDISPEVKAAVQRRMAPGSHFRAVHDAKRQPFLLRHISGHYRQVYYGGVFAGCPSKPIFTRLEKLRVLPSVELLPVETYRHHIAVKSDD